ncbi:response regulator transcription factor [Pseudoroseicyclus sp. CLL3-39]|uniref:Response regulator transcription factor n=2 Tax=Pseudoroseicyclus tamaricis TaxID=2705421 RepID=A0A6B2JR48_9RHOB|nr:response regulator transcription factor [Pseudoroseicyclus tamaricis]
MAIERTLRRLDLRNPVVTARSGAEALELLRGSEGRPPLAGPVLMLLDIFMPRMNGLELLDELRADPALQATVVFMLSSSDSPRDVAAAHERNVAGYLMKGASPEEFRRAMDLIARYLDLVPLPA